MQKTSRIKVAIIGAGHIAGQHLANLRALDRSELVGVCDIAPGRAETVCREHGGRPYTRFEEMLDREKPEAVLLTTPQTVRYEPIRACAECGIPVFLEKPPALDMAMARKTAAVLRQHKLLHSVGFLYRYCQIVQRARQLMQGRTVHIVRMYFYTPMIPQKEKFNPFFFLKEQSGGIVLDQAVHFLDLVRYLTRDEISEVHGVGSNLYRPKSNEITTDENITLNLRFRGGTVGSHAHTWAFYRWQCEIELVGPQARLLLDMCANKLSGVVDDMMIEYAPGDDGYRAELATFLGAVETGNPSCIRSDYDDAVKTLAVCLAANRSLETRKVETVELE